MIVGGSQERCTRDQSLLLTPEPTTSNNYIQYPTSYHLTYSPVDSYPFPTPYITATSFCFHYTTCMYHFTPGLVLSLTDITKTAELCTCSSLNLIIAPFASPITSHHIISYHNHLCDYSADLKMPASSASASASSSPPRPLSSRKLDIIYLVFFMIHIPIILCKFCEFCWGFFLFLFLSGREGENQITRECGFWEIGTDSLRHEHEHEHGHEINKRTRKKETETETIPRIDE